MECASEKSNNISNVSSACCGCDACVAVCPKHCISMVEDEHGFLKPFVDQDACISCGLCRRACPVLFEGPEDSHERAYWAQAQNGDLLRSSSSGGVFGLLATKTLRAGGMVVGAAFGEGAKSVRHRAIERMEDLPLLQSSKYVQSFVPVELYHSVEGALHQRRNVLFSGTACQVSALRGCLGKSFSSEHLTCVDVICHGVPSPLLWRSWISHLESLVGFPLCKVNFRDKRTGWSSYSVSYQFADESEIAHPVADDWYMNAFLNNLSLRQSCFSCPSKGRCGSDITLGDFWGVRWCHPEVEREPGVSCVIVRTDKGVRALDSLEDELSYGASSFESVLKGNPSLVRSSARNPRYGELMTRLGAGDDVESLMNSFKFERKHLGYIANALKTLFRL
ncbi:Coenzyme F420 hydrogenase/dehydrogenase, beta subunit C-terminal domain [Thermophilibacter sp.]|uniref:Coenzyme F420 hydrogenase/dehydrogenase, beta subunit C-terminal domain n=1 Tax=Thermophilibacter sp. TaxID=2847309 RepID=UPI003A92C6EF